MKRFALLVSITAALSGSPGSEASTRGPPSPPGPTRARPSARW